MLFDDAYEDCPICNEFLLAYLISLSFFSYYGPILAILLEYAFYPLRPCFIEHDFLALEILQFFPIHIPQSWHHPFDRIGSVSESIVLYHIGYDDSDILFMEIELILLIIILDDIARTIRDIIVDDIFHQKPYLLEFRNFDWYFIDAATMRTSAAFRSFLFSLLFCKERIIDFLYRYA